MKAAIRMALTLAASLALGCQGVLGTGDKDSGLEGLLMLGFAASATVTPEGGGTIITPTMTLTVPHGAVEEEVAITYSKISVPERQGATQPLQAAYEFGPEGLQFNKPATLTICYDGAAVAAQGLQEKTLQIQYYDQESGEYVSMGGDVNESGDCVSAPIYHFSAYILTAQLLAITDQPPTIGGATFFPAQPIAGLPLTVRSSVTDWDPGSGIATVRLFYRTAGSGGAWQSVAMTPDSNDAAGQFYKATVPAAAVVVAGLEYYIESYDTLNKSATRPAAAPASFDSVTVLPRDPASAIRFQSTVTQMSAGFSRDLTVQVKADGSATWYPVPADTLTFAGGKGVTSRPTWLSARYTAQIIGTSFLQATYGNLLVSQQISVYPGVLDRIVLLHNGAELPDPLEVDGASVTQIDAAGYDAFGNFMFVQPDFGVTNGIGIFGDAANYGKFIAGNVFPDTSGTITATIGGLSVSYNVLVHHIFVFCQFNVGIFDSGCIFQ